jgi:glc operon protein GlcG
MLDNFTRPSKALAEALVANNRTPGRTLPGALPMEGGLPMGVNENVIGAIGVSGVTAQQDGQMAKAGVDALPHILGP